MFKIYIILLLIAFLKQSMEFFICIHVFIIVIFIIQLIKSFKDND